MPQKFDHITVHCSATKPSVHVDRTVIDRWHRQKGWLGIGYHFVIRRDGAVEAGRSLDRTGAHVEGHNTNNLGICLAGGLNEDTGKPEDNYTPEQRKALANLLKELVKAFDVPVSNILGHRDWPGVKKECPCFSVKPWAQFIFNKESK